MPEFDAAYRTALAGNAVVRKAAADVAAGTLDWLIDQYRDSTAWQRELSKATRRQRDNIYKRVIAASGNEPYSLVTRADIEKGRDRRAATPHQARHFLDAMRSLFRWAYKASTSNMIRQPATQNFSYGGPGRIGTSVGFIRFFSKCDTFGLIERQKEFLLAVAPYTRALTHRDLHRRLQWHKPTGTAVVPLRTALT